MARLRICVARDGTVTYEVDHAASDLPPVQGRDILAAWGSACEAARASVWGDRRAFRFRRHEGGWTDLVLQDRDAMCWAAAVDRMVGLDGSRGLSICLRLLALVDLLGRVPWAGGLVAKGDREAKLSSVLARLAAQAKLTDDACFDEADFCKALEGATGACEEFTP